jgi:hypothetical protein
MYTTSALLNYSEYCGQYGGQYGYNYRMRDTQLVTSKHNRDAVTVPDFLPNVRDPIRFSRLSQHVGWLVHVRDRWHVIQHT